MGDHLAARSLWRVKSHRTGDYVRASRGTEVIMSPHLFSLFEFHQLSDGAMALNEHWSSRSLQVGSPGYAKRLGLAPLPRAKRRYLHWHVNWPPGAPPPPPPPQPTLPIPSSQRFYLERQRDGMYSLSARARGGKERGSVRQSAQGTWLVVSSSRTTSEQRGGGDLFELQRVASAVRVTAPGTGTATGASSKDKTHRTSLARAMRHSVTRLQGRSVVLATAYNARGQTDVALIFWSHLAALGNIRGCLLLSTDMFACEALRTLNSTVAHLAHCITPSDLDLPTGVQLPTWRRDDVPHFETDGNTAEQRFLQRCKLAMLSAVLSRGHDVAYLDVDVLVLNHHYLGGLLSASASVDLTIATDPQTGFHDDNSGRCLRVAPANVKQLTWDWVHSGHLLVRASEGGRWFFQRAALLMDSHVITDNDALQALLTGHAQVSDPLRASRHEQTTPGSNERAISWLKPMWLEADHEPFTTTGGSALARSRWIRPLNAPLALEVWRGIMAERARLNFTWTTLSESRFLTLRNPELWEGMLRKQLGAKVADGAQLSIRLSCHVINWLAEHRTLAARLLRVP
mmetsp:Transcript_44762/g.117398  ORF Transcript_44762/g.117398 Transcript_44762/m.117398 type:complete len:571 (+) Transcript_44762:68-1780(+)